jgi:hypothetical protein
MRRNSQQQPLLGSVDLRRQSHRYQQQRQQQFLQQQRQQQQHYHIQQQNQNFMLHNQFQSPMGYPGGTFSTPVMPYPPYVVSCQPTSEHPPPYPGFTESQPPSYEAATEKTEYQVQPPFNPNL